MTSDYQQLVKKTQNYANRYLASPESVGIGIGVYQEGEERVVFGGTRILGVDAPLDHQSLFEIGSISKVLTATLLAEMHVVGDVNLDDPVNDFLPPQGQLSCRGGADVTLRHLATHTSGLPRLPTNLNSETLSRDNPYKEYSVEDLYQCIANCHLRSRPGSNTLYSNLGSGLLGHALSLVSGCNFEQLMIDRILHPLDMRDTRIQLFADQQRRLVAGHSKGQQVRNWDFQALAGAGAFRSTIPDMLRFVQANIDPSISPISRALELTHVLQTHFRWKWYGDVGCIGPLSLFGLGGLLAWRSFGLPMWLRIAIPIAVPAGLLGALLSGLVPSVEDMALGWHCDRLDRDDTDSSQWSLWHNGCTAGYASYLAFSQQHRTGVVLLANSDVEPDPIGRELLKDLIC
jgi:CubicO group peptidase (beta-lactamase class C family)